MLQWCTVKQEDVVEQNLGSLTTRDRGYAGAQGWSLIKLLQPGGFGSH